MSTNSQTTAILNEAFAEVCNRFPTDSENLIMTDILLQVNLESGQLVIYNDDDEEIFSTIVEEWVNIESSSPYEEVAATLRQYIADNVETLDNLGLIKPYSYVLIDDERETICELHLVDDQLIAIDSQTLMENLDKDLDDFFDRLMKD